jgi:hypothetical protein
MPYATVDQVPDYVPEEKKPQWKEVWNSVYGAAIKEGTSKEDAEASAFAQANGVAGPNSHKKVDVENSEQPLADPTGSVKKYTLEESLQKGRVFRLSKVDELTQTVSGVITDETPDKSNEICDYESSKPYYKKWSDEFAKATGGQSLGNVREMHKLQAAGKLVELNFDDANKTISGTAKVVDPDAWNKCKEGVYTGFSHGGAYVGEMKKEGQYKRYTAQPSEVSLVDNPANPNAHFTFVKADGTVEERKFKTAGVCVCGHSKSAHNSDGVCQSCNQGSAVEGCFSYEPKVEKSIVGEEIDVTPEQLQEMVKSAVGDLLSKRAKPGHASKKPYGNVEYADPGFQPDKKKRYPLDTEKHIRAAHSYIGMPKNSSKYTSDQLAHIKDKVHAAWKRKIDPQGPPSVEKATVDYVAKYGKLPKMKKLTEKDPMERVRKAQKKLDKAKRRVAKDGAMTTVPTDPKDKPNPMGDPVAYLEDKMHEKAAKVCPECGKTKKQCTCTEKCRSCGAMHKRGKKCACMKTVIAGGLIFPTKVSKARQAVKRYYGSPSTFADMTPEQRQAAYTALTAKAAEVGIKPESFVKSVFDLFKRAISKQYGISIEVADGVVNKATNPHVLQKGMNSIARLANLLLDMAWLHWSVQQEQESEGDTDSPLPADLQANIASMATTLVTMAEEETKELVAALATGKSPMEVGPGQLTGPVGLLCSVGGTQLVSACGDDPAMTKVDEPEIELFKASTDTPFETQQEPESVAGPGYGHDITLYLASEQEPTLEPVY